MTITTVRRYMNQRWGTFCQRIRNCTREQRLQVIALLDDAVEEEYIRQRTADDILTEWDVLNFPEQMPKPLVAHVKRQQRDGVALLTHAGRPDAPHPEEEDEPCPVIPIDDE